MIDLLERAATASPGHAAVVTTEGTWTYGELADGARRVAAGLRTLGASRVAVIEPDAAWVVRLLAGAALAGVEACQYQPDTDGDEFSRDAAALGHGVVVTSRTDIGDTLKVVRPDELSDGAPDKTAAGEPQPLVIRTTGTTGLPKAARHDWRVLARTVAGVRPAPDQRWLLAYGPHQFAGVQVLLHVTAAGATLVAPFPRQPRDGLEALLGQGVTCVSATPTYWRFLLAEARARKAELPPLEQITLGGEASSAELLEELRVRFPAARLSQVYASTEFGSVTSVSDGRPGIAVDALWSDANPAGNLRVEEGELWVRPGAGMLGYLGDTAAGASDTAGAGPDDWRPTGDLVEVVGDRVLFRGRRSEIINVGGVKVHPLPVENRIAALESVALARVFARPNQLTGAIVAVEVVPAAGADPDSVKAEIRKAVSDLPRAWHPRSITLVESIETKGGKVSRRADA